MGDRVKVWFVDNVGAPKEISPGIYLHWNGYHIEEFLRGALAEGILRVGDVSYASARFCGYCHVQYPGMLGLGLLDPLPRECRVWTPDEWDKIVEDRGVYLVMCAGDDLDKAEALEVRRIGWNGEQGRKVIKG